MTEYVVLKESDGPAGFSIETAVEPAGERPSEFWAGKASAAFVLSEHIKAQKKLVDALTALLKAVKTEPAMNQGQKYDQLGIQVHDALNAARFTTQAWECAGRKQTLPEPGECCWPVCGCDPQADKVIEALQESGDLVVHTSYRMTAPVSR